MKQVSKSNLRENLKTTGIVFLFIFLLGGVVLAWLVRNIFGVFICTILFGFGFGFMEGRYGQRPID